MAKKDPGFKKTISAQELLNELYIQIRELEERLRILTSNLQLLQIQHNEIEKALETVKSLDKLETGHEVLLPIGAGVYGTFTSSEIKNLTVGIGSKIFIEKTPDDTTILLEKRLAKSEEIVKKLQEDMERTAKRHQTLSQQFQLVAQRIQQAAGQIASAKNAASRTAQ
ncbi:MAG: prefoldin subunit alpha [Candidatus Ranarchaeia archaeon]